MVKTAFDMMDAREEEREESAEPPVEAVPRLTREALGYLEPRPGLDGKVYAGQCASCQSFVPEAALMGAVMRDRCALLGAQFSISDDDSCNRWAPWPAGAPNDHVVAFHAAEIRKGLPGALSVWMVGYKSGCTTQCRLCRFGDVGDPETAPGKMECEAFESLNEKSGNLFALETTVDSYGGCNLWQERPAETMPGLVASER